jgi:trans-aconitate methyltransferase
MTEKFDASYYQRYYENPATRAASPEEQTALVQFIASYLRYLQVDVATGLDIGCGTGAMLRAFNLAFPESVWTGVEVSDYLCSKYGWRRGSVLDTQAAPSDLVICSDVLGYLNDRDCTLALSNLTRLCKQALYLSVLTSEDLDICDQEVTDMSQTIRSGQWYKAHLADSFVSLGGGVFLKRPLQVPVWHMERL